MAFDLEDTRDYIPKWQGNRDLDESEQVVLTIAPMTGGELRKIHRAAISKDGKVDWTKAQAAVEEVVRKRVVSIENCIDILDRPIQNGEQLMDHGEQFMIDEAYAAITEASTLRSGLKKRSP
jgi:hypothetical protein